MGRQHRLDQELEWPWKTAEETIDGLAQINDQCFDAYDVSAWRAERTPFCKCNQESRNSCRLMIFHRQVPATAFQYTIPQQSSLYRNSLGYSSLTLYQTIQPDQQYAKYSSALKNYPCRRFTNRFRCGCHELRVDSGHFATSSLALTREQQGHEDCGSLGVEDEHQIPSLLWYDSILKAFLQVPAQQSMLATIHQTLFPSDNFCLH